MPINTEYTNGAAPQQNEGERIDVLFVLCHDFHVRNFVASDLVNSLIKTGRHIAVVVPDHTLPTVKSLLPQLKGLYPISDMSVLPRHRKILDWLKIGSMVHRRDKVEYRWKVTAAARASLDFALAAAFWYVIETFSDAEKVASSWISKMKASSNAVRFMRSTAPRLVVWPTTIATTLEFEIVKAASEMKIPVLMCEGSWDNFTTKGAIWPRPEQVLVWGDYSRQQAIEHHGFAEDQIIVTGSPHFDIYGKPEHLMTREEWFAKHELDPSKRLILFGGTTIGKFSEEAEVIRLLSTWIDSGKLPPSYILYRPHPRGRHRAEKEGISSIPNVIIDYGVTSGNAGYNETWAIHPDDALQRANVLAACDVILSSFSTIVIEGALLGKPSVLIGFAPRKGHETPVIYPSLKFSHLQYILQTPRIVESFNEDELFDKLQKSLELDPGSIYRELRQFGMTIAHCNGGNARQRIVDAIINILESK